MSKFEDGMAKGLDGTFAFRKRYKYAVLISLNLWIAYLIYQGFWAMEFAEQNGCDLHEGFTNSCLVDGKEWGEILYSKFTIVTMMSFGAPIVAIPFLLLARFLLIDGVKFLSHLIGSNKT